jgi:hypothetical protein
MIRQPLMPLQLVAKDPSVNESKLGWSLSKTMFAKDTAVLAWKMACNNREITQSLIFHSDRGIQYACK